MVGHVLEQRRKRRSVNRTEQRDLKIEFFLLLNFYFFSTLLKLIRNVT